VWPLYSICESGRQAIVSLHHQPSCQIMSTTYHKINSISSKRNNIIVNETTQIAHSLTQSGVQGSSTDASASSRSETLHTQRNRVSSTCLHQGSKNILSYNLTHHNERKSFIIIKSRSLASKCPQRISLVSAPERINAEINVPWDVTWKRNSKGAILMVLW
jgi:hypothetical protein